MKITSWRSFVLIKVVLLAFLTTGAVTGAMGAVFAKSPEEYPANNTGRNGRDADGNTLTPEDQSGNAHDRQLIQSVRKSIVSDDSLSMNAKNIKIVSVNGKLTLRGPVNSAAEKDLITRKAVDVAGVQRVDDQLEIIAK